MLCFGLFIKDYGPIFVAIAAIVANIFIVRRQIRKNDKKIDEQIDASNRSIERQIQASSKRDWFNMLLETIYNLDISYSKFTTYAWPVDDKNTNVVHDAMFAIHANLSSVSLLLDENDPHQMKLKEKIKDFIFNIPDKELFDVIYEYYAEHLKSLLAHIKVGMQDIKKAIK